jgi:hypothetical protein
MQSSKWHDPARTMNEMELVIKKFADFEAIWRTSERLTKRCSEGNSVSIPQKRSPDWAPRREEGDLEKAA